MKNKQLHLISLLTVILFLTLAGSAVAVQNYDQNRVIFLVLDGARGRTFDRLLDAGELPNLAMLAGRGTQVKRAVGAFPSTTGPAYAPFVTGCLTGKAGVPGIRWYDRVNEIYRVYCGSDTGGFDKDLNPDVKTIYELLPTDDSLAVFGFIERGCKNKTTPFLKLAIPKLTGDFNAMDRALFDSFWQAYREHGYPRYAFLSMHAPDSVGHAVGPDDSTYDDSIRYHDSLVGELVARLKGEGLFASTTFMITSDHGQQNASQGMDTKSELERVFGMKVYNSVPRVSQTFNLKRKLGLADFDAIFAVSGNSYVMVYVKDPDAPDMKSKPSYDELRAYPCPDGKTRDLVTALLELPAVRTVFLAEGEGRVRCVGRDGESRTVETAEGLRYEVISGSDPLGYDKLKLTSRTMNATQWLEATARAEYPDGPVQVASLFQAAGTGDLVFISEPGWEPWNEGQKGVHGSLIEDQNIVPFLVSGPDVKQGTYPAARTADFFPLTCELLGLQTPAGIDGSSLPILKSRRIPEPLAGETARVALAVAAIEEKAILTEMSVEQKKHNRSLMRIFKKESDHHAELGSRLGILRNLQQRAEAGSTRAAAALLAMPFYSGGKTVDFRKTELAEATAPRGFSLIAFLKSPFTKRNNRQLAQELSVRQQVAASCLAELEKLSPDELASILDPASMKLLGAALSGTAPAAALRGKLSSPMEMNSDRPGSRQAYEVYVAAFNRVQKLIAAGETDPAILQPAMDEFTQARRHYEEFTKTE